LAIAEKIMPEHKERQERMQVLQERLKVEDLVMIDSKIFIEFFEKEYGTKFVDIATGKNALDIMRSNRTCGKCKHVLHGDGKIIHIGDMVCGNTKSESVTDFMSDEDSCMLLEAEGT